MGHRNHASIEELDPTFGREKCSKKEEKRKHKTESKDWDDDWGDDFDSSYSRDFDDSPFGGY